MEAIDAILEMAWTFEPFDYKRQQKTTFSLVMSEDETWTAKVARGRYWEDFSADSAEAAINGLRERLLNHNEGLFSKLKNLLVSWRTSRRLHVVSSNDESA